MSDDKEFKEFAEAFGQMILWIVGGFFLSVLPLLIFSIFSMHVPARTGAIIEFMWLVILLAIIFFYPLLEDGDSQTMKAVDMNVASIIEKIKTAVYDRYFGAHSESFLESLDKIEGNFTFTDIDNCVELAILETLKQEIRGLEADEND